MDGDAPEKTFGQNYISVYGIVVVIKIGIVSIVVLGLQTGVYCIGICFVKIQEVRRCAYVAFDGTPFLRLTTTQK